MMPPSAMAKKMTATNKILENIVKGIGIVIGIGIGIGIGNRN
jgi:hypothetical protein